MLPESTERFSNLISRLVEEVHGKGPPLNHEFGARRVRMPRKRRIAKFDQATVQDQATITVLSKSRQLVNALNVDSRFLKGLDQ